MNPHHLETEYETVAFLNRLNAELRAAGKPKAFKRFLADLRERTEHKKLSSITKVNVFSNSGGLAWTASAAVGNWLLAIERVENSPLTNLSLDEEWRAFQSLAENP